MKNKKFKSILVAGLIVPIAFVFAGCGFNLFSRSNSNATTTPPPALPDNAIVVLNEPVTLTSTGTTARHRFDEMEVLEKLLAEDIDLFVQSVVVFTVTATDGVKQQVATNQVLRPGRSIIFQGRVGNSSISFERSWQNVTYGWLIGTMYPGVTIHSVVFHHGGVQ